MTKRMYKDAELTEETFNSDENTLLLYLQEINRIPLLSRAEEEKTSKLAAEGNEAAREKLINANLRFVVTIAKKYQGKGLPLEDIISEGNIGLLNAMKHFDATRGYRFLTYAVWWIRQCIVKALHEKGRLIRLPNNKTTDLSKIEMTRQVLQNEPGWQPGDETRNIARYLDITEERAQELINFSQDVVSLDDSISRGGYSLSLKDFVVDEYNHSPVEYATNSLLQDELETALGGLDTRAAEVIRCRFGLEETGSHTLKEVGNRYDLSRERVRQIEKRALLQLQHSAHSHRLESYIA